MIEILTNFYRINNKFLYSYFTKKKFKFTKSKKLSRIYIKIYI